MYHGDTNEGQCLKLHMIRKEREKGKMAVNRTSTGNLQIISRPCRNWVTGHCQLTATDPFPPYVYTDVGGLYPEPPLKHWAPTNQCHSEMLIKTLLPNHV